MKCCLLVTLTLVSAALVSSPARGDEVRFINPAGGEWSAPENWSGGAVPTHWDNVRLPNLGQPYVVQARHEAFATNLQVEAEATLHIQRDRPEPLGALRVYIAMRNEGTLILEPGDPNESVDLALSGPGLVNTGRVVVRPGGGAFCNISGNIDNFGEVQVQRNAGLKLDSVVQEAGALLVDGELRLLRGRFNFYGGEVDGTVRAALTTIELRSPNPITLRLQAACSIVGGIGAGQTLIIEGSEDHAASLTAAVELVNNGTIVFENGNLHALTTLSVLREAFVMGRLVNRGVIQTQNVGGGSPQLLAHVVNEGMVSVDAGQVLRVAGTFRQSAGGSVALTLSDPATTSGTLLAVGSELALGGRVELDFADGYRPALGTRIPIFQYSGLIDSLSCHSFDELPVGIDRRLTIERDFEVLSLVVVDGPPLPGDLDCNCSVDISDMARLLSNFGAAGASPEQGDLDGNGLVELSDLANLLIAFGNVCQS